MSLPAIEPTQVIDTPFDSEKMTPTTFCDFEEESPPRGLNSTGTFSSSGDLIIQLAEKAGVNEIFEGAKDLNELRERFQQRCADLENEYPELAHKDGWKVVDEILQNQDSQMVGNHTGNIDTLLAGLYSAVLTAFIVEAYKLLQRDSADATVKVLVQISQQMASFAVNPGSVNSTYIPTSFSTERLTPDPHAVWLNVLWFVALILSLTSASLGMLVKQWLREYLNNPYVTPEEQRRVRLYRIRGLRKYKVSEIAAFLPLLLQMSLVLFFVGLALFTRGINNSLGWVVTGFVVVWLGFLVVTTSLPWFSSSCPYKTPFLKPVTMQFKRLLESLYQISRRTAERIGFRSAFSKMPCSLSAGDDDEELQVSQHPLFDSEVLFDAYKASENLNGWEKVMDCVDPHFPFLSLEILSSVTNKRHLQSERSITLQWDAWDSLFWFEGSMVVKGLVTCLRWCFIRALEGRRNLGDRETETLLLLDKCSSDLVGRFPTRMNHATRKMTTVLMQEALSIPFYPRPLFKYISGLLDSGIDKSESWGSTHKHPVSAFVETVDRQLQNADEYDLMELCGATFLCAKRAIEEWHVLEDQFPPLVCRLTARVKTLPAPSIEEDLYITFKWHCILNLAMRLHKQIPGVIDKAVLDVLHTRSVKMFNSYVKETTYNNFRDHTQGKPSGTLRTSDVLVPSASIDWPQILDDGVGVEVKDVGEYGDEWDCQRLQVDCKYRMEFILNYENGDGWPKGLRSMLNEHHF